jgi:hypothetical protein
MTVVKSVSDGLRDSETQLNLNRPLRISPGPRHLSRPLTAETAPITGLDQTSFAATRRVCLEGALARPCTFSICATRDDSGLSRGVWGLPPAAGRKSIMGFRGPPGQQEISFL